MMNLDGLPGGTGKGDEQKKTMTTAVKRACDACHRRKVKCDGVNPCRNCSASQLACTYNAIPQKKGPKGSRAKVISELRENQRQTTLTAKLHSRMNGTPTSPTLAPTPGLLNKDLVKSCIEFFFAHMYPTMPILDRARLEQESLYTDTNLDTYCLLTSLCAFVSLQPGMVLPGLNNDPFNPETLFGSNIITSTLLMEETIRVRKGFDYVTTPTLNSFCTSYFLFAVHCGLDLHDKAWFHLREATTLAHMVGMNKEPTYLQYDGNDSIDSSRRRRLYWLLYMTERVYALQHHRPMTLEATINLPAPNDNPADPLPHHLPAFLRQVNLFRPFDSPLVSLWNRTKDECSEMLLSNLEKQLQATLPSYLNNTEAQLAEIQPNQQWLKGTAWQLGVASGNGNTESLPFQVDIADIASKLLPMVNHLPGNLGFQGLGLIEKLLSVTLSLTDILASQPSPRSPFQVGPHDQLRKILNIVTVLRNGDHRFLPLLLDRVHSALPRLASPMLQNAPEGTGCNIDIFDGFGNGGMAQPPMFSANEYDNKFAVPRLDDLNTDSSSPSGGASSNNEMNSPFVSSPPIMSPGMELPHGLPTDFTSMPEMVMSPMSHAPPPSINTGGPMGNQQVQHAQHSQHQQHPQHTPHTPISPFPGMNSQMQGLNSSNINPPPNIALASQLHMQGLGGLGTQGLPQGVAANMMGRPPPQRTNSFAMAPPPIRTVGDFQALQRVNSDMSGMSSLGINHMGTELDFNTLPSPLPR